MIAATRLQRVLLGAGMLAGPVGSAGANQATRRGMNLRAVKIIHTAAWAVFASAIVAIPLVAIAGNRNLTEWLILLVAAECLVLAVNRMRCPLTSVAAKLTDDRRPNFDIYLPATVARYNKEIFGSLFIADVLLVGLLWWW